jgi:hypothetical protein
MVEVAVSDHKLVQITSSRDRILWYDDLIGTYANVIESDKKRYQVLDGDMLETNLFIFINDCLIIDEDSTASLPIQDIRWAEEEFTSKLKTRYYHMGDSDF